MATLQGGQAAFPPVLLPLHRAHLLLQPAPPLVREAGGGGDCPWVCTALTWLEMTQCQPTAGLILKLNAWTVRKTRPPSGVVEHDFFVQ